MEEGAPPRPVVSWGRLTARPVTSLASGKATYQIDKHVGPPPHIRRLCLKKRSGQRVHMPPPLGLGRCHSEKTRRPLVATRPPHLTSHLPPTTSRPDFFSRPHCLPHTLCHGSWGCDLRSLAPPPEPPLLASVGQSPLAAVIKSVPSSSLPLHPSSPFQRRRPPGALRGGGGTL